MIKRISHIGIAVRNLEQAVNIYNRLFGSEPCSREHVEDQKVNVAKYRLGESTVELLEGTSEDSAISRFIEKRGEGIHHIAYETDDIDSELIRLDAEGFELINRQPVRGSDNMLISFIKPSSVAGVLTEICKH
jgi:methylmalonyl-CoA/ethylmalonyl-CoA epimerase